VLVVEEGEPFLEEGAKAIAQEAGLTLPIRGKAPELLSRLYEFDPAMVRRVVGDFFGVPGRPGPGRCCGPSDHPPAPPTLCAGCSHRATYYEVRKAAEELGIETLYPSDIGCYTLVCCPRSRWPII